MVISVKRTLFTLITILFLSIQYCLTLVKRNEPNDLTEYLRRKVILATYNAELRTKEGRVDVSSLIKVLLNLSANTYNFLIWHNPEYDFKDFIEFCEKANKCGLLVWADIVPPSEPPLPKPYLDDYVAWAKTFAEISLKYKCFVAFTIDDFEGNLRKFTRNYVEKMVNSFTIFSTYKLLIVEVIVYMN